MKIRLSENKIRVRFSTLDKEEWLKTGICTLKLPSFLEINFIIQQEVDEILLMKDEVRNIALEEKSFVPFLNNEEERYTIFFDAIQVDIEKDYPCEHRSEDSSMTFQRPQ